jgi:phage baseplate assembly protein W
MKIEPMNNTNEVARQNENFKDIDLDFIAHPATGDVVKKVGAAAIKRAMRNLVFLKAGEIPFNSRKGGSLHHTLFELYTPATVEILKRQLLELFINYEPRVNVFQIEVEEDKTKNGLNIDINFEILNYNEPERLTLFLERVR